MLGQALGEHLDGTSEWLDDRAHRGPLCPRCGSDQTLERFRASYGPGLPVHRHSVIACFGCEQWSHVCFSRVSAPEVVAWQPW